MNIFFTSPCPKKCAEHLDDVRVNKMILETAQMLSTALIVNGHNGIGIYKATHKNHPSNIWVRQTRSNFLWLTDHLRALYEEKLKRTGKGHKSFNLHKIFLKNVNLIPEGSLTPFVNCAANNSLGISYKQEKNVFLAYQLYLNDRWNTDKREPKWYGIIK